ncbi:MAG: trimethylamine methyltransferase family protein [Bacillota bacterium]
MPLVSKIQVLSKAELGRVHEASVKILEETGVVFQSDDVLELFRKNGIKIDGQVAFLPRKVIEKSLETCPQSFKWWARNEENSLVIGAGQGRMAISPNQGNVYIQDLDNGRRPGKIEDYANIIKLCQASSVVNTVGAIPIEPGDIKEKEKHLHLAYNLLKNTDKPLIGFIRTMEEQRQVFDMVELAMGQKDYLLNHPSIAVSINPISPLRFGSETLESAMAYASHGQPVFILPCIIAGVTGPISLFGTTILQNAEILAGIVLTQLINPGNPVVYSPASSVANMKKGNYITGSPEANLMNIACIQMAIELYNLPTRSMAGLTDSKVVDCQAGYETMQNIFMLALSGVNIINESLGVLDSIMTTSYEKFVIDEEILSRVIRIQEGIDTSDERESVELIQEIAHTGSYLEHSNTFDRCRERWQPAVANWDSYEDWKEGGAEDVVVRANRRYKEILNNSADSLIDPELDKNLRAYMKRYLGS